MVIAELPHETAPPAWAAGTSAHVLGDDEVVLLSEATRVVLRGRVYAAIAPLIDGSRSDEEIVAGVGEAFAPAVAHYALIRLRQAGRVIDAAPATAAPPPVEVATIGIASEAAAALRARIAVLANDAGRPAEPLTVALVDDYLRPELAELAAECSREERALLPCRPIGPLVWLGPLLAPGSPGLWELLVERLRLNRRGDVAALAAGAGFPLFPVDDRSAALGLGVEMASATATGILSGEPPDGIESALLTFDRAALELTRHPLSRVGTPAPRRVLRFGEPLPALELRAARRRFATDNGHRQVSPKQTLARIEALASPITGVVSRPQRTGLERRLPVYTATCATAPGANAIRRPTGSMGKGLGDEQARASCIAEGIERYSCQFFGDEPRRRARLEEIAELAIDPRDMLLFSDAQYAARRPAAASGYNTVPAPFDAAASNEWSPVRSLTTGATRWVPAANCFFGYYDSQATSEPFARGDSNGCAAGNTIEEALLQGLLELIERDATALWWYPRVRRRAISLESFKEPLFDELAASHDDGGLELAILDLTVDTDVAVVAAVSWRRTDGGGVALGLGAHLDPRLAASRALSELEQTLAEKPAEDTEFGRWFATETIETQPYLLPADAPPLEAGELPRHELADLREELDWCVAKVESLGHDVLAYDHTRADVGFPVVRVIAPGLRHFWRRLAPGRLYDVPVSEGLVARPQSEDELNPIGFFL
jgi:bacteriocin biosynthesis cyclodehydratase domain-containing protein